MTDPRITELEELAESEGIMLPMPPALIIAWEDAGYVVDLATGEVSHLLHLAPPQPTPTGRAISHLLQDAVGEFAL